MRCGKRRRRPEALAALHLAGGGTKDGAGDATVLQMLGQEVAADDEGGGQELEG